MRNLYFRWYLVPSFVSAILGVAFLVSAGPAVADKVYHSERLELAPVAVGEVGGKDRIDRGHGKPPRNGPPRI